MIEVNQAQHSNSGLIDNFDGISLRAQVSAETYLFLLLFA